MKAKYKLTAILSLAILAFPSFTVVRAQTAPVRNIVFPVIGAVTYWDDFGAERDGGARSHEGNDLMGKKMLPLVAAVDGTVRQVIYPEADYGYSVVLQDSEGYTYHYLHINNDTPGTDDGKGLGMTAYAVDMMPGNKVAAGQLIGWMGDSGNAETTTAHLHFEIRKDGTPYSPYQSLKAARKITAPVYRPKLDNELLPYDDFGGGASVALGNLDKDSEPEIVTAPAKGGGPHIKAMNQDGTVIGSFFAYDQNFTGGVDVAIADVDGDGRGEIITAPGKGGGPNIKIFKPDGTLVGGFMAYDAGFTGGVNVTAADVDDDDEAEIITAPGKGGGPHVRVFKPDGKEVNAFFAYDPNFNAGTDVAAYSSGDDVFIATAPGAGGGPHVKLFDGEGNLESEFMAYDPMHFGGVRITLGNFDNDKSDAEIITVPLLGGPQTKVFTMNGESIKNGWGGFEQWWQGSWDVAAYNDDIYVASGVNNGRRTSVREATFNNSGFGRDNRGFDNDDFRRFNRNDDEDDEEDED